MSKTDSAPGTLGASRGVPMRAQRLWLVLAALVLFLPSCETAPPSPASSANATPPFYEVRGGRGATLHLLGTIHLGPPEGWSLPREIDRALAQASALVMEIDLREATEENVSNAIVRHAILPDSASLSTIIGPETKRLIDLHDDELRAAGLVRQSRERLKPWFIALSLVESATRQTRYWTAHSVDELVFSTLDDRPLLALETVDEQLGLLDALPSTLQELMLQDALIRMDSAPAFLEELVQAWRQNDQPALIRLARESAEDIDGLEAFFQIILDDRNQSWMSTLVDLLESPERADTTVFVAVGAMHLVGGAHSVPGLLQRAGYRVDAVPVSPSHGMGNP